MGHYASGFGFGYWLEGGLPATGWLAAERPAAPKPPSLLQQKKNKKRLTTRRRLRNEPIGSQKRWQFEKESCGDFVL